MQTERKWREMEVLKLGQDYVEYVEMLYSACENMDNESIIYQKFEKMAGMLADGLMRKVKYVIKISRPWTKPQSFLSKWKDKKKEKEVEEGQNTATELEETKQQLIELTEAVRALERIQSAPTSLPEVLDENGEPVKQEKLEFEEE